MTYFYFLIAGWLVGALMLLTSVHFFGEKTTKFANFVIGGFATLVKMILKKR